MITLKSPFLYPQENAAIGFSLKGWVAKKTGLKTVKERKILAPV
jgi:hypothetical protein